MSRLQICLISLALLVTASCDLDPFAIPTGDGGVLSDGPATDALISDDATPPDARQDSLNQFDFGSVDVCLQVELCNNVDDNCDGQIDEGYDKLNDPQFCNGCLGCQFLVSNNAVPGCNAGQCAVASCAGGFLDLNGDVNDGCEYECTPTGPEICDGVDNDCDGMVDNGVTAPINLCKTAGVCGAPLAPEALCQGQLGWICDYKNPGVELQTCTTNADCGIGNTCVGGICPGILVTDELLCDGLDGDCDGAVDEPWDNPNLPTAKGKPCDPPKPCINTSDCGGAGSVCSGNFCTPKNGQCRDMGQYICDPINKNQTICNLVATGQAPGPELCNDKDDDCDGVIDNDITDNSWTLIPGPPSYEIFSYEAARPDATGIDAGIQSSGTPCSRLNLIPWAEVSQDSAQNACERIGARLCTVAEWQTACRGQFDWDFPYGPTYDSTLCNGRAYDPVQDTVLHTANPQTCISTWPGQPNIFNMSGNLKEWVATSFTGPTPDGYEIKGGAYDTPSINEFGAGLSCNFQLPNPPASLQLPTIGFRCCRDAP